jgi:glycosyltransferase involved in cell wall biosynthesis
MRILKVSPSFYPAFSYGGPIVSTYELCRNLPLLGCEVRVLTTDTNGLGRTLEVEKGKEVCFEEGFSVRYCHRVLRHSVAPTLIQLLPQYIAWADVVHLDYVYSFPTLPTHFQCRLLRKPLLWSPHGALMRWERSSRRTSKAIWDFLWYHGSDLQQLVVHLASEQEEENARARFPKLQTAVIPNGVDVPAELNPTESNRELRLLFIGRLDPIKGIENLLKACSTMAFNSELGWRLAIAGGGKPAYVAQIKKQIVAYGLNERVRMVGEVLGDAKKKLFENSDVALVPSYKENFGIVVAESLAHGIPVIASRGTPWGGLEQKGCGLWVENDPETLASAIRRISTMPMRTMGLRGREWMRRDFSWRSVANQMLDLYRESVRTTAGWRD